MDTRPIGIFDSGSGGLTTVRALARLLPNENIVYIGDTARMPYGERPREEISHFSHQLVRFLLGQGVKAVIAACGTISSNAPELLEECPVPCFDVISSSAAAAARATVTGRIGLAATPATIRSGAFAAAIREAAGPAVTAVSCPLLAPMIEHGTPENDPALRAAVEEYCRPLRDAQIDTLVLGCTHFPLISTLFAECLGGTVTLIDSGAEAAAEAAGALRARGLLAEQAPSAPHFYFTGEAEKTARQAGAYLYGQDISADTRELPLTALTEGGTL